MPWFPPPHSSTPGIFIVVFILWVFFLLSLKRFNQFPNIKSIPTHLTHIIHEEAFSPAFAHRHREAATKSLWGQSFKIRNLRKAGHTLFLLLFLKNWSRFLNILNVIIVQDSKIELCVIRAKMSIWMSRHKFCSMISSYASSSSLYPSDLQACLSGLWNMKRVRSWENCQDLVSKDKIWRVLGFSKYIHQLPLWVHTIFILKIFRRNGKVCFL